MPHIVVEHSGNLADTVDVAGLLQCLKKAALETRQMQEEGLRIRSLASPHWLVGDGSPTNAFMHITVRIRPGRSEAVKTDVLETLHEAACNWLQPQFETMALGLTIELQEIDIAFRRLRSSLPTSPELIK
ncbi:5-carboxymethyl-2-hydroxymuconate Delta-isomerase [Ottowia thiooxydans]|uniref:5-carboxymethyl-2-hydroxymuconate Delta-isomerase n=1 Tax=Ottowia thiooxydans TaxID=219182 RepID=UPI0003FF88C6|nr:5-carboxymethyl-2-hydroxymuconate Delta-isomerase [Ottowia thiooxydans]